MSNLASWAARKLVEGAEYTCELKDLIGVHVLTGVDYSEAERVRDRWAPDIETNASVLRFILDGVTFRATEDPDDGYRSSMREIGVSLDPVKNVFAPCTVLCRYLDSRAGGASNLIEMLDTTTGKQVLCVGTDNSDDYYPSFTANFLPEHMAVNLPKGST